MTLSKLHYTCNKVQPRILICKNLTFFVFKNCYLSFLKLSGIIIINHTWGGTESPIFASFNDGVLFFVIFRFFIRIIRAVSSFTFWGIRITGATPAMRFVQLCVALYWFRILLIKYLYRLARTLWILMWICLKGLCFI